MNPQSQAVICRVRTLYPFYSDEKTSLSFNKDECIDVLAQLETGWWDGICNGIRGWFPSNYVQIISDTEQLSSWPVVTSLACPNSTSLPPLTGWTESRVSLVDSGEPLPEGWATQSAYYSNARYARTDTPRQKSISLDSDNDAYSDACDGNDSNIFEEDERTNRLSLDSLRPHCDTPAQAQAESPTYIMSQWVERTTPQGRVYFCNLVTQESAWSWDSIDPATGRLYVTADDDSDLDDSSRIHLDTLPAMSPTELKSFSPALLQEVNTWEALSQEIAQTVRHLTDAIQLGDRSLFSENVSAIVKVIRLMLYSARSMDKDVLHVLQEPHRAVLSALSKLVLSAKTASESALSTWFEKLSKVQYDAGNVMAAARSFVNVCKEQRIEVERVSPMLINGLRASDFGLRDLTGSHSDVLNDTPRQFNDNHQKKARYSLNAELVFSLEGHAKQINASTDALTKAAAAHVLRRKQQLESNDDDSQSDYHDANYDEDELDDGAMDDEDDDDDEEEEGKHKARATTVSLFYNLSLQIGQYLLILKDIDFTGEDAQQLPPMLDYKASNQKLYNAVGDLFAAVQSLTDPRVEMITSVASIQHCIRIIEDTVGVTISSIDQIMGHRKSMMLLHRRALSTNLGSMTIDATADIPDTPSTMTKSPSSEKHLVEEERSTTTSGGGSIHSQTSSPLLPYPGHQRQHQLQYQDQQQRRPSMDSNTSKQSTSASSEKNSSRAALARQTDGSETWFLRYDYMDEEIEFGSDGNVRGGTLSALIERLTLHDTIDMSFIANFLLTYRSFCTTEEFVGLLEKRYNLTPPPDLTVEEQEIWMERKQKLVRLRVFNLMKNWLENYYNDEDEFILNRLEFFANAVIREASSFSADQLNRLIRKRKEQDANGGGVLKKMVPAELNGPMPILPKNMGQFKLLDIDPLELSRQLCLLDFKLYSSIRPIECLGKAWSRDDDRASVATNVKQSIDYCNRLTAWVTASILEFEEAKKRVVFIKFWAQVANRCRLMNNYNTCMAIISAFDNSAIGRLKKTWELVGSRTNQVLMAIRKLMGANRNFTAYREMVHSVNPPCIPFLGIYLQDLTFIEDGNADYLKRNSVNLINFAKQQKSAEVIREIKQFQSPQYAFQRVPELQQFIWANLDKSEDVDKLYERSLLLEPKETIPNNH